jgi:hypothetical protein
VDDKGGLGPASLRGPTAPPSRSQPTHNRLRTASGTKSRTHDQRQCKLEGWPHLEARPYLIAGHCTSLLPTSTPSYSQPESKSDLYPIALVISLRDYRSGRIIGSQLVLLVHLIPGCVGWFFESVVGRILDSGCQFKIVFDFEFYLPGCSSYRCLPQFILVVLQLVILIGILRREDWH